MKLFDRFRKKDLPVQQEEGGMFIPDHAKTSEERKAAAIEEAAEENPSQEEKEISPLEVKKGKEANIFVVNGNYDMGAQLMLSGVVQSGTIKKGMKTKKDKTEMTIVEMKISSENVKDLNTGEEGTIFLKYKIFPNVKYDDVLEFK